MYLDFPVLSVLIFSQSLQLLLEISYKIQPIH